MHFVPMSRMKEICCCPVHTVIRYAEFCHISPREYSVEHASSSLEHILDTRAGYKLLLIQNDCRFSPEGR